MADLSPVVVLEPVFKPVSARWKKISADRSQFIAVDQAIAHHCGSFFTQGTPIATYPVEWLLFEISER